MSLATTCPQCKTSFKVVPDQLKLRRGLVRCGRCQHVFSGIDFLRYVDDGGRTAAPSAAKATSEATIPVTVPHAGDPAPATTEMKTAFFLPETVFAPTAQIEPPAPARAAAMVPPASIQLRAPASIFDPQRQLPDEPATQPMRASPNLASSHLADDTDAIDYFSSDRNGRGFSSPLTPLLWLTCLGLTLLLLVQLGIGSRNWLAAQMPDVAPALATLLKPLGLKIEPPADLKALTIESFELQASAQPEILAMSALLRNRANYPVRWPAMELTLTDGQGGLLVRKVIQPADYLKSLSPAAGEGLKAMAELPIRLALEARDLSPSGYSVTLFYP